MPRHGLLVTGLFSTRFLCGCYLSILATAMPTLANNVDREVSQTSWIISFRNFGIFFGGLLGSKVMKNRRNPVSALVAVICLSLLVCIVVPYVRNVFLLDMVVFALGFANGCVESLGQITFLQYFPTKEASKLIASFHLLFNFGGVGGSMIMHEVIDSRAERSCPGVNLTEVSNRAPLTEDKFPYAFFIPAALHIPVVLLLIFIKAQKSLEKLKQESTFEISTIPSIHEVDSDLSDGSSKVPLKSFTAVFLIFMFSCSTVQQNFTAYIHQYTRCTDYLDISSQRSANNVVYFWLTNSLGRLSLVLFAALISIKIFLALDVAILLLVASFLSMKKILTEVSFLALVDIFGFAMGVSFPAIIIYANHVIPVERGGFMWMFYTGAQLLPIFNPVIIGNLMEIEVESFTWVMLGSCGLMTIFLVPLYYFGEKIRQKYEINENEDKIASVSASIISCQTIL